MKGIIPDPGYLAMNPPGYRIKYYRLQNNLTQKELAEKCGLTESAIRNYELGNRNPNNAQREKIARVLKVSVHSIDEPNISQVFGMIHVLFDIEKIYQCVPKVIDGEVYLHMPKSDDILSPEYVIHTMTRLWAEMREKLDSGEIDLEYYINWQAKYPEFTTSPKKRKAAKTKAVTQSQQ